MASISAADQVFSAAVLAVIQRYLATQPAGLGTGSVTSVSWADASGTAVYGAAGPVTTSGTLAPVLNTQSPNKVFAGPGTGTLAGQPTFRSLVAADIPGAGGTGSVTSVSWADSSGTAIFGSAGPVTTSGTLAPALAVQSPNKVFAGPGTGTSSLQPVFRSLVAADIPILPGVGGTFTTITQAGGTSQTYTVPAGANFLQVILIAGGGGGASGGLQGTSVSASGGAGGGGGGISYAVFQVNNLPGSVTITFSNSATGGNGAAAVVATGGGTGGVAGSNVQFGTYLIAYGGAPGVQGAAGAGGSGTIAAGSSGGGVTASVGSAGSVLSSTPYSGGMMAPTGGGGGGTKNTANTPFAGGAGGGQTGSNPFVLVTGGAAGASAGGQGGQGNAGSGTWPATGGGGGGSANGNTNGGTGGAGGTYGAGGGGGGGAANTGSAHSGAGGQGGFAACLLYAW